MWVLEKRCQNATTKSFAVLLIEMNDVRLGVHTLLLCCTVCLGKGILRFLLFYKAQLLLVLCILESVATSYPPEHGVSLAYCS